MIAALWTALLVGVVAVADYASGVEISFVVLTYLVPIAYATWFGSRRLGFATAVVAATATSAIFASSGVASTHSIVVNAVGATGTFLAFTWLVGMLHERIERERERVRTAIDQLRHAERLNVLGTLAAGVAHELGTPLNVISGAAEMLEEGEPSRARDQKSARLILAQTERITVIIRRLLDFARRGHSERGMVEVDHAVSSAVELLSTTARKRGTTIEVVTGVGARRVRANAQELEQVVSNLLLNGIQAMPEGGQLLVTTAIDPAPPQPFATIAVEDSGTGIAPADLPHIFDPFFTTKDVGQGTGLGLSVSYGIVTDLGGTIDVASEPGRGTRFVVRVPLATAPATRS